jgi:nuclear pore complex protein Nup155
VFAGVLKEINRAWISIDERLFLWNYEDGRDFCVYDGVEQVIVSVGLVRTRPGLFVDSVKYLLIVATPVDVVTLAVSFAGDTVNGELTLHPTGLSVPSDNVHMCSIAGTDDGRAFLAGADGSLYELSYAAEDGWLSQRPMKCRKTNRSSSLIGAIVPTFLKYLYAVDDPLVQVVVDSSRGLLYTLSAASRIEVRVVGVAHGIENPGSSLKAAASVATRVAAMDAPRWRRKLGDLCTRATDDDKRIVSLHPIGLHESGHVHLVAVTERGSRLYFTTHKVDHWARADDYVDAPSETLRMLHVRLAPPNTTQDAAAWAAASAATGAPTAAFASATAFALPLRRMADADSLLLASQVPVREADSADQGDSSAASASGGRLPFRECATVSPIDSRTFALTELPVPPVIDPYLSAATHSATLEALARPSERSSLSAQAEWQALASSTLADAPTGIPLGSSLARHPHTAAHLLPPRRVLCLSGMGLSIYRLQRPLDALQSLLLHSRGDDSRELREFFTVIGAPEACAMCFVLASAPPPISGATGMRIAGTAPSLLQLSGGAPQSSALVQAALNALGRLGGAQLERAAQQQLQQQQLQQRQQQQQQQRGDGAFGRAVMARSVSYSATHEGLALYMSRCLRPVWQHALAVPRASSLAAHASSLSLAVALREATESVGNDLPLVSRLDPRALERVEKPLRALHSLLQENPQLCGSGRDAATRVEAASFAQLCTTIALALDSLAFWRTLCENDFTELTRRLAPSVRSELLSTRFRDIVASVEPTTAASSGDGGNKTNVARLLLNELIALHSERGNNVDFLAEQLRTRCVSLFAEADRVRFKAHEVLQRARVTVDKDEQYATAMLAVERFCSVAASVNLPPVCKTLAAMYCHVGALDLVLAYARAIDPNRLALTHHMSSSGLANASSDAMDAGANGNAATLLRTPVRKANEAASPSAAVLHQRCLAAYLCVFDAADELLLKRTDEGDRVGAERARRTFEAFKRAAAQADDQLFHICLYDWFLRQPDGGATTRATMESELLALQSPYLENYLKGTSVDLLCRFYVRNSRFEPAALILVTLAERRGATADLTLERRIENLSRAKGCLVQAGGAQTDASLSLRVHEKLDVARLQLRVRDRLRDLLRDVHQPSVGGGDNDGGDSNAEIEAALRELEQELFVVSDLYNRFARRFRLYEEQLALIHCAGHADRVVAQRVWTQIVRSYAERDPPTTIGSKVAALGREYYPSDVTFPIAHIALLLERHSLAVAALPHLWVARSLHAAGAAWPAVFGVYDALLSQLESAGDERGLRLHLLRVTAALVNEWLTSEANARLALNQYRLAEPIDRYIVALRGAQHADMRAIGMDDNALSHAMQLLRQWV